MVKVGSFQVHRWEGGIYVLGIKREREKKSGFGALEGFIIDSKMMLHDTGKNIDKGVMSHEFCKK